MWEKKLGKVVGYSSVGYENLGVVQSGHKSLQPVKIKRIIIIGGKDKVEQNGHDWKQDKVEVWFEFNELFELRKAYSAFFKLSPSYCKAEMLPSNDSSSFEMQYIMSTCSIDGVQDCAILSINVAAQTKNCLEFLVNYLKDLEDDIPPELLFEIKKYAREMNDSEQIFYQKLVNISELEHDSENLLGLAKNIVEELRPVGQYNCYKPCSNPLWELSQKCMVHSDLWVKVLSSIEEDSNCYEKAQYELSQFEYSRLSEMDFLAPEYFESVKKFLKYAISTDPEQDIMNLLSLIIFTIVGENAGISLGDLSCNFSHKDNEERFINILAKILLSHKKIQQENVKLQVQHQELKEKYEQLQQYKILGGLPKDYIESGFGKDYIESGFGDEILTNSSIAEPVQPSAGGTKARSYSSRSLLLTDPVIIDENSEGSSDNLSFLKLKNR